MSRTLHHIPYRRLVGLPAGLPGRSATVTDLRYSTASLTAADGERPRPHRRVHRVTVYSYLARLGARPGDIGTLARRDERGARRALRDQLAGARGLVRAGGDPDDVDIPPIRHRHNALWDAI